MHRTIWHRLLFVLLITTSSVSAARAELIPLPSPAGAAILRQSLSPMGVRLMAHYVTQEHPSFCGVASAVMVLNAAGIRAPAFGHSPAYSYFTQDAFFTHAVCRVASPTVVRDRGLELTELARALSAWGLSVTAVPAPLLDEASFRSMLHQAFRNEEPVIVNFSRTALQQVGTGHYSPLGAIDVEGDRVLVLDVARYKEHAFWISVPLLWQAVRTPASDGSARGILVAHP